MGLLSDANPKCLTKIAGKTLLAWQMEAMRSTGIEDLVVVRGYRAQNLPGDGYQVVDNQRWAETNMVMSLAAASEHLAAESCFVSYADIVYHPDAVSSLIGSADDIAIAYDVDWVQLWKARFEEPLSDAETFRHENGRLVEIGNKAGALEQIQGQYMGLLKFTPTGWAYVVRLLSDLSPHHCDRLDMTSLLGLLLGQQARIGVVPVEGRWCEVDSPEDLNLYKSCLADADATDTRWHHDWRW